MTVRGKIFMAMGVLVMLVTAAYIGTTQGYLGSLFARYVPEGSGGGLEGLEGLSKYVLGEMKLKALMVTLFVACAVVILGYWLSGLIIHPLHKLIAVMRKVADGDLTTEVPIKRKDEYGQVGEAFNSMTHQLREAMDLRKRLVEDIAHELRMPLSFNPSWS
ncbi:HAMP domain-containing protein [Paenibacillus lautus]